MLHDASSALRPVPVAESLALRGHLPDASPVLSGKRLISECRKTGGARKRDKKLVTCDKRMAGTPGSVLIQRSSYIL